MEFPWVHTGVGESAQLECVVQANPEPEVRIRVQLKCYFLHNRIYAYAYVITLKLNCSRGMEKEKSLTFRWIAVRPRLGLFPSTFNLRQRLQRINCQAKIPPAIGMQASKKIRFHCKQLNFFMLRQFREEGL